jgi:predicted TIM-barrel fold metal-dependent hydrolase
MSFWNEKNSIAEHCWKYGNPGFPVYDMHGHMGEHYAIYFKRSNPAEMVAHLKKAGVAKLVFSHHYALWEPSYRNENVFEICRQFPETLRFYVGINPHYPEIIKEDLALVDKWRPYAVGIKMLAAYHHVNVTDKAYEYALKFADERGIPVLNHTWGGIGHVNDAPSILKLVEKYQNIRFFHGHSFCGDYSMVQQVVNASAHSYLELTAIPGENGMIEELCRLVGSEKIIYGTDLPWFDEFQAIGGVVSAKISDADKRNILCDNVERIMGKNW